MAELTAAEGIASAVAEALAVRARVEAERREGHDLARAALTTLQLTDGRLTSELEAIGRDRGRLVGEREGAEADAVRQRRALAAPIPSRDGDLERAVVGGRSRPGRGDRGTREPARRDPAKGEELAAIRRAEAVRTAELETARRRLAESEKAGHEERAPGRGLGGAARRPGGDAGRGPRETWPTLIEAERDGRRGPRTRPRAVESAEALRAGAADRAARVNAMAAAARGRLQSLEARLAEDETRGIARAATQARRPPRRRRPGRRARTPIRRRSRPGRAVAGLRRGRGTVPDLGSERGLVVVERAGRRRIDAGRCQGTPLPGCPRGSGWRDPRRRGRSGRRRCRAPPAGPCRLAAGPGGVPGHPGATCRPAGSSCRATGRRSSAT